MKEDAQLVCPVSFEDKQGGSIWQMFSQDVPLTICDVTWKSPISSQYITIDELPLRFLPESANLFKDTEHSFRWFLAPYVQLYVINVESMDIYKSSTKAAIRKWVDSHNINVKKAPWLLVYHPNVSSKNFDVCNKIYSRIVSDFYVDRPGDRSVMLLSTSASSVTMPISSNSSLSLFSGSATSKNLVIGNESVSSSFAELLSKLREGIVQSFQMRTTLYDAEIRRLDAQRGATQFDFRQLFLVKESLALMYQMMQLSDKALAQYEELEALLASSSQTIASHLPESDWL